MSISVHMIFNAHLDPIWLWPWQAGLDSALATCRSACDRLDAHPDLVFTRGEAWVHAMVEQTDPALFARIREHVAAGRWEIIGGWWIQPDCNLPSGFGFERQIALGQRWFRERFGRVPRTAYNVDSFGHCATLPGLLRAAGQDRYVMMRPQEHELALPARLFRWRGYDDGPEVTCFRIAGAYCHRDLSEGIIRRCVEGLPAGLAHTMCFAGVGDHGGGPTEAQIAWVRAHADAFDGLRLEFSSVERFFDAVEPECESLPLVVGELQHHAIGCFTVHRAVKTGVRRAEHLLRQAEVLDPDADLSEAWRHVVFNQFHDTLGGTCLPSAYAQVDAQLGCARAVADERLHLALRRRLAALPDDRRQRVVAANASDARFDGWVEFEPWLDWRPWAPGTALVDEQGSAVPYQRLASEATSNGLCRLLFPLTAEPGALRVLRIVPDAGWSVDRHVPPPCPPPWSLDLVSDPSDTWSHGLDRYAEEPVARAVWDAPQPADSGPLMASVLQAGRLGASDLLAEWRVYRDEPCTELRLRVMWLARHAVLKLTLPLPAPVADRLDGIPGGSLRRANDGCERPLRDWTWLGPDLAVVCPDVFALDATRARVRLTLLRSPLMAHHDPHPAAAPRATVADQGGHEFRFRFWYGAAATPEQLETTALGWQRPLVLADLTRGM